VSEYGYQEERGGRYRVSAEKIHCNPDYTITTIKLNKVKIKLK
jgi:hypothetical protein